MRKSAWAAGVVVLAIVLFLVCICSGVRVQASSDGLGRRARGEGVAICACVRHPMEFDAWLGHHFSIGVHRIFLRVEESPEVFEIIQTLPPEQRQRVHTFAATSADSTGSQWWSLQKRQAEFCRLVKKQCLEHYDDVTWILQNLDDDELLHCADKSIEDFLRRVPSDKRAVFVNTVEALYPDASKDDERCFRTDTFVKCDSRKLCTSYYGGKSLGLLTDDLEPSGPHQFKGMGWSGTRSSECYKPSIDEIAVLHHESCNYKRWREKFKNLAVDGNGKKIPEGFTFYNKSLEMASRDDDEALRYYESVKVSPYRRHTPSNKDTRVAPYIV
jgi:hypothetical protein